jgi:hypothetical protein
MAPAQLGTAVIGGSDAVGIGTQNRKAAMDPEGNRWFSAAEPDTGW